MEEVREGRREKRRSCRREGNVTLQKSWHFELREEGRGGEGREGGGNLKPWRESMLIQKCVCVCMYGCPCMHTVMHVCSLVPRPNSATLH